MVVIPVMGATMGSGFTVKDDPLVAVPPAVVTSTLPEVAPAGTVAVI